MKVFFKINSILASLLITMFFVMSSCNVHFEKRRYRPGYHVEVVRSSKDSKMVETDRSVKTSGNHLVSIKTSKDPIQINKIVLPVNTQKGLPKKETVRTKLNPPNKKIKYQDSCDVLFLSDGERLNVLVIEVGEDYVHYKMCDDPKGRLHTVKTKMIDNITFRNGEYFIPKDRVAVDKDKERAKSNTLFIMAIIAASVALIAFVLSFFIYPLSAVSLSFSIIDLLFTFILMMVNIRPSKYAPSYRTKFTWILTVIAIILIIAALVIVFL